MMSYSWKLCYSGFKPTASKHSSSTLDHFENMSREKRSQEDDERRERKREKERKLASLPYLIRSNFISSGEQERYQHFSFFSSDSSQQRI